MLQALPDTPERAPARAGLADYPGRASDRHQGASGSGSGTCLQPGAGAVPAGRGDSAAFPGPVWSVIFSRCAGGVTDRAEAERRTPQPGPAHQDPMYLLGGPLYTGGCLFCLGEFVPARSTGSRVLSSTIPSSTALICPFRLGPGACLAVPGRPCPMVSRLSRPGAGMSREAVVLARELSHPYSLAYGSGLCGHVLSIPPGAACRPRAGRGGDSALYGAGVCVLSGTGDDHAGLGTRPRRARTRRAWRRYARVWPPCGPRGQALRLPYFLALLAEACGQTGQATEGLALLAEALAQVHKTGEPGRRQSCIGSRGSCCYRCLPTTTQRLKDVCIRPSL